MGFSAIPPRPDQAVTLQALNLWTSGHADAAIMHVSVPYLALLSGLSAPQEIRGNELGLANYYRAKGLRLRRPGEPRPVLVVEGGWTSISLGAVASSPAEQARYLAYQGRLLDSARAIAVFQLTFTDLDLSALSLPPGSILPLFAHLGVVDSALGPKPALAAWDQSYARPLAP